MLVRGMEMSVTCSGGWVPNWRSLTLVPGSVFGPLGRWVPFDVDLRFSARPLARFRLGFLTGNRRLPRTVPLRSTATLALRSGEQTSQRG
jgi:hypothetical protein